MRDKPEKLKQFIGGSASAIEEGATGAQMVSMHEVRVQKSVMLQRDLILLVKEEALKQTLARGGRRVTESDLYEEGAKMLLRSRGVKV